MVGITRSKVIFLMAKRAGQDYNSNLQLQVADIENSKCLDHLDPLVSEFPCNGQDVDDSSLPDTLIT